MTEDEGLEFWSYAGLTLSDTRTLFSLNYKNQGKKTTENYYQEKKEKEKIRSRLTLFQAMETNQKDISTK